MNEAMLDRIEVAFPTCFNTLGARGDGEIRNISHGGLFIETPATLKVGDKVDVTFRGPSGQRVEARGVVWWTTKERQFYGDTARGFGVRLLEESETYRGLIAHLQENGASA